MTYRFSESTRVRGCATIKRCKFLTGLNWVSNLCDCSDWGHLPGISRGWPGCGRTYTYTLYVHIIHMQRTSIHAHTGNVYLRCLEENRSQTVTNGKESLSLGCQEAIPHLILIYLFFFFFAFSFASLNDSILYLLCQI